MTEELLRQKRFLEKQLEEVKEKIESEENTAVLLNEVVCPQCQSSHNLHVTANFNPYALKAYESRIMILVCYNCKVKVKVAVQHDTN